MNKMQRSYMKMMQSGQITDDEVAETLNISLDEVRCLFAEYSEGYNDDKWTIKAINIISKIIDYIIYGL